MKNKNKINSHILLPKSILERFSFVDSKGRHIVNYIDIKEMKIKEETTSSFNTRLGYYDKENERILSNEAESKIGNVIRKLQNINDDTILNIKDLKSIYKFLTYQVIRTDFFAQQIKDRFNSPFENRIIKNIFISGEMDFNIVYNVVKEMDIYIIINKTKTRFVIPINSMYTFYPDSEEKYLWVQILSPDIAVAFMKYGTVSKLSNNTSQKVKIVEFNDGQKDIIDSFNLKAFVAQYQDCIEMKYVVGFSKELKQLLDKFNNLK